MDGDKDLRGAATDIEREDFTLSDEEREEELAQALSNHAHMSSEWYQGEIKDKQAQGIAYYLEGSLNTESNLYGRTGDEGTISGAISRDVAEIVDWLMPDLKRLLVSNENYFEFKDDTDENGAKSATQISNMVMEGQAELDTELDNWIKNGLLAKVGIMHVYPVDPMPEVQEFDGLNLVEISRILADPRIQENTSRRRKTRTDNTEEYPDGYIYSGMFEKHLPRRLEIETVPPEDFLVSNDVDRLSQEGGMGPAYVGRVFRNRTLAELMTIWPEHGSKLKKIAEEGGGTGEGDDDAFASQIRAARDQNSNLDDTGEYNHATNLFSREITIFEEWYRYDWDKDGIPELRYVVRGGKNTILVNEIARDNPFAVWQPYPVPHAFYGESLAEKIMMLQDARTSILRALIDVANLAARPRIAFDADRADQMTFDSLADILDWNPGAAIRAPGPPGETLMEISVGPNALRSAIEAMAYLDELKAAWGGVSRQQQGLNPEKMSRMPKSGADVVSQAGNGRKEYLARRLGVGMESLAKKIIMCAQQYLTEPFQVMIDGQMTPVDPGALKIGMQARVHISGALGNRDREIEHLMAAMNAQQGLIQIFGPSNPYIGVKEVANLISEMMNAFGFKDSGRFIRNATDEEINNYMQQMSQQEDPAITAKKIEAESAVQQTKMTEQMNKYRLDNTGAIDKARLKIEATIKEADRMSQERIKELDNKTKIAVAKIQAAASEAVAKSRDTEKKKEAA